ncbi:MAG: sugar transferase [Actinobacteria bacterium]|nr:sugar transferase [Actinomycetota bacterium]
MNTDAQRRGEFARLGAEWLEQLPGAVDVGSQAPLLRRGWLVRRLLVVADVVGLVAAYGLARLLIRGSPSTAGVPDRLESYQETLLFLATLPAWLLVARLYRLYDRDEERTDHDTFDDFVALFHVITVGAWLLMATAWLTDVANPSFAKVAVFWASAIVLVTLSRAAARAFARTRRAYIQNAVIVGAGEVGQLVARKLLQHPEYGVNLVGFVDADPKQPDGDLAHLARLGGPAELRGIVELLDVERVIVAFSGESHAETLELIRSLQDYWVQIDIVPRLFEIVGPSAGIHTVGGLPLVGLPPLRLSRTSRLFKRALDVSLAGLGLVVLAPVFALVALLIRRDSPGPVLFRQERVGFDGETFAIYKFRTMTADADDEKDLLRALNLHLRTDPRMFKVQDDPRVTRLGRVLRRYSIDELPQLVNVLRGEMSLVGPRPLIPEEARHVDGWARKRLSLKPGVTGLWQVYGRSGIPFEEMVKLDYLYVTTWSLWNDLRLLFRTLPVVVRGESQNW